jgi:uncharacterized protein YccT (UPF0319 family)
MTDGIVKQSSRVTEVMLVYWYAWVGAQQQAGTNVPSASQN